MLPRFITIYAMITIQDFKNFLHVIAISDKQTNSYDFINTLVIACLITCFAFLNFSRVD